MSRSEVNRIPKKWEVFPGRNTILCNGRILMAQRAGLFHLCVILILLTSGLFFAFDCPYLSKYVSPGVPVVSGILFIAVLSNLFKTSFSDPGILPRATGAEATDIERQNEVQPVVGNGTTYRPPPRTKEIVIKSHTMKLKYCCTCKIFRPPRASHCSICDNCVDRFDHHCPWVGNCVGLRNYRYFYMFLVSLALQCVFYFTCALSHLILISRERKDKNFLEAIRETPTSVFVCIICFLSIWSVLGLVGFHTYLVTSNLTTNEDIKGSYSNKRTYGNYNPFNEGNGFLNCHNVLCSPIPPSLIDLRGKASEDYLPSLSFQKNSDLISPTNHSNFCSTNQVSIPTATISYNGVDGVVIDGKMVSAGVPNRHYSQTSDESLKKSSIAASVFRGYPQVRQSVTISEISSFQNPQGKLAALSTSPDKKIIVSSHNQISTSLSEHILSHHNIGLHNQRFAAQETDKPLPNQANSIKIDGHVDLDHTTMIGLASDLESLSGEGDHQIGEIDDEESRVSIETGSQIGLIKMSYSAT